MVGLDMPVLDVNGNTAFVYSLTELKIKHFVWWLVLIKLEWSHSPSSEGGWVGLFIKKGPGERLIFRSFAVDDYLITAASKLFDSPSVDIARLSSDSYVPAKDLHHS